MDGQDRQDKKGGARLCLTKLKHSLEQGNRRAVEQESGPLRGRTGEQVNRRAGRYAARGAGS